MSATTRPWKVKHDRGVTGLVDANGHAVMGVEYAGNYSGTAWPCLDEEIAELIVSAVNCHDELVAALWHAWEALNWYGAADFEMDGKLLGDRIKAALEQAGQEIPA